MVALLSVQVTVFSFWKLTARYKEVQCQTLQNTASLETSDRVKVFSQAINYQLSHQYCSTRKLQGSLSVGSCASKNPDQTDIFDIGCSLHGDWPCSHIILFSRWYSALEVVCAVDDNTLPCVFGFPGVHHKLFSRYCELASALGARFMVRLHFFSCIPLKSVFCNARDWPWDKERKIVEPREPKGHKRVCMGLCDF